MADCSEANKANPTETLLNTCASDTNERRNSLISAYPTSARTVRDGEDCVSRIPKSKLTFFVQIIVVYGIIAVSVYHLSVQSPNQELWLVLLSSAFGYILPSPGLKYLKRPKVNTGLSRAETRSVYDTDFVDGIIDEEKGRGSCGYVTGEEREQ